MSTGDLGIQVQSGGQLDAHGTAFLPTWTRLSATAQRGNNWLSLQVGVKGQSEGVAWTLSCGLVVVWVSVYTTAGARKAA